MVKTSWTGSISESASDHQYVHIVQQLICSLKNLNTRNNGIVHLGVYIEPSANITPEDPGTVLYCMYYTVLFIKSCRFAFHRFQLIVYKAYLNRGGCKVFHRGGVSFVHRRFGIPHRGVVRPSRGSRRDQGHPICTPQNKSILLCLHLLALKR